jgi:hypothetical protein
LVGFGNGIHRELDNGSSNEIRVNSCNSCQNFDSWSLSAVYIHIVFSTKELHNLFEVELVFGSFSQGSSQARNPGLCYETPLGFLRRNPINSPTCAR